MARIIKMMFVVALLAGAVQAQPAKWASADDKTAQHMIALERRWAESACANNGVVEELVADDFQGTGTDGKRTTKADELRDETGPHTSHGCQLDEAKVRFFGENVAIIYGAERRILKQKDGSEAPRCQIWTDTWLRRDGRWQVVAAQDSVIPCK